MKITFVVKTLSGTVSEYTKKVYLLDQYIKQMKDSGIQLIAITYH